MKTLKITLVKSPIGSKANQKATLKALGLNKIGSSSERVDNEQVRGMIKTVAHLVSVVEA
jgi:large subunit ribosomal protein L30